MSVLLDTDVLLGPFSDDARKADRAEQLVADGAVISVQVLNERVAVARRKLAMNWSEIADTVRVLQSACAIEPVTVEVHHEGRRPAEKYPLAWHDALIASAALQAGCTTLYREDLHDGLRVDDVLSVRNPFSAIWSIK